MMEHLKDIVNGLLSTVPQEKWKQIKEQVSDEDEADDDKQAERVQVIILLKFENLDTAISFSKRVPMREIPYNSLYKYSDEYYLIMDLSDSQEAEVKALSMLTDEYVTDIQVGGQRAAFIEEHGECIVSDDAVTTLSQL